MSITRIQVVKYRTQDGQEFNSEFDAREHELFLRLRGAIQRILPRTGGETRVSHSEIARALLDHADSFGKEFGNIRQCLTRLDKVSVKAAE